MRGVGVDRIDEPHPGGAVEMLVIRHRGERRLEFARRKTLRNDGDADQRTAEIRACHRNTRAVDEGRQTTVAQRKADKLFVLTGSTTALVGTFNGLAQGGTGTARDAAGNPTWSYQISYTGSLTNNATTGGNDIVLYNFSPVPEPGAVLAVATGCLGAVGLVRRRRRAITAEGCCP